ncbi:VanW family protein [Nocardioides sp.]|uniref:VanW family protein n=1 Tax=Nocardioides sp. TaxID=35761 RepID=UPI002732D10C|nr:VanW family protein [Nocardioides sp.]MDP3892793.1 VanW family protein [Nocardioides sp.]
MTDTVSTTEREGRGGRVVLLLLLGLALLFGGAYAAAYYAAGDNVPRGTTVAGVDIGGEAPDRAADVLRAGLADRELGTVTLQVAGDEQEVAARRAGLSVDHEASVADAGGGRSWRPGRLWNYFTGGDDLPAVITVDQTRLSALLDSIDERNGTPAVEGEIAFRNGSVEVTDPEAGEQVDRAAARAAIEEAYLDEDATARLPLVEVAPEIDEDAVEAALDGFANPAMSGPVTLGFGKSRVRLAPRDYSAVLSMEPDNGALVPEVDTDGLQELIDEGVGEEGKPVDATVRLVDGKPKVIKSKPGVSYEIDDVAATFVELVARESGERSQKVKATVAEPEFTTKDARALNIKEKVSTFTTYYPHADYRNTNIGRAAELVNGTILKPGEVFSLNDVVGERTAENGFARGFIISNGVFKQDFGGGVSQMATTTFNAMFFAGLKDIEHKPHSFYISRYPVGREATVAWGSVDLRFENDTEHGVLIQSFINPSTPGTSGSVTVSMWSTKTWDISTSTSDRYNFTPHKTRQLSGPECEPHQGYGGFDVDVTRAFRKPGQSEVERREVFKTTYTPADTVECKKPDPPEDTRANADPEG